MLVQSLHYYFYDCHVICLPNCVKHSVNVSSWEFLNENSVHTNVLFRENDLFLR